MKFPHSMLLDYVQTNLDAQALGDLLTMAGFELEGIDEVEGEPVLDIKVMSNRGDGLSVFGLSREVLAKDPEARPTELYRRAAGYFGEVLESVPQCEGVVDVQTEDCTRYGAALFDVEDGRSPDWMAKRLFQAGMRPISLMVDVTNYVMLEIGQPLHAFDRDRLAGGRIVVRKAHAGERLTTLNGEEHELRPEQMMICDAEKPAAVAGVMGGEHSEVTSDTRHVLLESAHFVNTSVRRTRRQLNLTTEASYRFERSVDRELVVAGLARTVDLLHQILGRSLSPTLSVYWGPDSVVRKVPLRVAKAVELLGMEVSPDQAKDYLGKLGFGVSGDDPFEVTIPTWRQDIEREVDLVEEIGRVHGFEKIPEQLMKGTTTRGGVYGAFYQRDRLIEAMLRLGFIQTISHSLRTEHPLDGQSERIAPRVPASPEYAVLRNSLLPHLVEAFRRNGGRDLHLFEVGSVFAPEERVRLGVLSSGAVVPPRRKTDVVPEADFFFLKGVLEEALGAVGVTFRLETSATPDPRFHPTRQALVVAGMAEAVGMIGQIHTDVAAEVGVPVGTILAEIELDQAFGAASSELHLRELSRHPAVRRDLSVLVDKSVPYERLERIVVEAAGPELERHWLFDVYEGTGLPAGKHALGIALQLRKPNATFTDEEANLVRERVAAALAETGATMR